MADHDKPSTDEKDQEDVLLNAISCDIVRFTLGDMNGLPRTKLVRGTTLKGVDYFENASTFLPAMTLGHGPRTGITLTNELVNANYPNAEARPDPATFHEVKWASQEGMKVGEVNVCIGISVLK